MHAQPASRKTPQRRPRYASRGQALIMAVLLMFMLAGLGGVFIAMLNLALVQTARGVERAKLEDIAQAGMNEAQQQLRYSSDGADWRPNPGPDLQNRGWIFHDGGFYKIRLTYGRTTPINANDPFLDNPLDRYLKIDVEASLALKNPPSMADLTDPALEDYQKGYLMPRRYLSRKITAYVPIALTDYLLWVTNLTAPAEPAVLGPDVPLHDFAASTLTTVTQNPQSLDDIAINDPVNCTNVNVKYRSIYDGPIRVDGPLEIGDALIYTTRDRANNDYGKRFLVRRDDLFEVLGKLSRYEGASACNPRLIVNGQNAPIDSLPQPGAGVVTQTCFDPAYAASSATLLPLVVSYLQTHDNNALLQTLQPPRLDQPEPATGIDRYRALTRDSGYENASAINTGLIGWGEGVYITNREHLQHPGNQAALRAEWLTGSGECWQHNVYQPREAGKAVELVLHDWGYAGNTAPSIELIANDNILYTESGTPTNHVVMPYPRNGVIFAEGNLTVKGNLPTSKACNVDGTPLLVGSVQAPGGWEPNDRTISYYVSPMNRRFDLTIVSGGTIYIEGNLLTPASRLEMVTGMPNPVRRGSEYDSKLGLLARDNVCLNPTRLFTDLRYPDGTAMQPQQDLPDTTWYWRASAANSAFVFTYATAGNYGGASDPTRELNPRTRLLLRHAGEDNASFSATTMQMAIAGSGMTWNYYQWTADAAAPADSRFNLQFCDGSAVNTLYNWIAMSSTPPEWPDNQWGGGMFLKNPFTLQSWPLWGYSLDHLPDGILRGLGRSNRLRFEWTDTDDAVDAHDGANYLLHAGVYPDDPSGDRFGNGSLVTCIDLEVDALIYAQQGSWFIIPGHYWYETGNPTPMDINWPFPKANEPYDVRIIIDGAIAENHPAPADAQRQWMEHWRGSNIWYFDSNGDGQPDLRDPAHAGWDADRQRWRQSATDDRRQGIEYHYDATLTLPVCYEVDPDDASIRYYTPRLPKLPVCPTIFKLEKMRGA